MPTYKCKIKTKSGNTIEETIIASNSTYLREIIRSQYDGVVLSFKEVEPTKPKNKKVKNIDLIK